MKKKKTAVRFGNVVCMQWMTTGHFQTDHHRNDSSVNDQKEAIANGHKASLFSFSADRHVVVTYHRAASRGVCHQQEIVSSEC